MSDQNNTGNSDGSGASSWNSPDAHRPGDADRQGQYDSPLGGSGHDRPAEGGQYGGSDYPQQSYDSTPSYSQPAQPATSGQGAYAGGPGYGTTTPTHVGPKPQGMAIAALVCGIIGLLSAWVPVLGLLGVLLAIIAVVLGIIALLKVKKGTGGGKGLAIAGLITGALALLLGIAVNAFFAMAMGQLSQNGDFQQAMECAKKPTQAEQQACMEQLQPSPAPTTQP